MENRAIIGIVDNLESTSTTDALSANQGRVLKGMIDDASSVSVINNLNSTSTTDALSANQGRVLNITKQDKIVDTGWKNITLSEGIVTYGPTTIPQYRKIGNVVYIRGAVKNILTANTIVGVLPEEARPTGANHNYLMPTTNNNGANFARIVITAAGQIKIESISSNLTASYGESRWFPINTSYIVD